jgi:ATP-dependent protease ClpP protease subunit
MSNNELYLYGTVGGSFWEEDYFTAKSVRDELSDMTGPITVRINSGGGIASEGQAIYTMLVDYPDKVTVVVDGIAASAASLIAMAGEEIIMRRGAFMLIHDPAQPWTMGRGTEEDHLKEAELLRVLSGAYADIYAFRAGMSRDEARAIMKAETGLDGPMAVDLGFATSVDADAAAVAAARFDYRMYANAPKELREASKSLGRAPEQVAIMAMIAGTPRTSRKETKMENLSPTTAAEEVSVDEETTHDEEQTVETVQPEAVAEAGVLQERDRARRITTMVSLARLPATMAADMITRGITVDGAMEEVTRQQKEQAEMSEVETGRTTAKVRVDARDKFKQGAELALMKKAGLKGGERNEFSSLSLSELAREALMMGGDRERFSDKRDMIGRAFTMAGSHTVSDFSNILANVMGKGALQGWEEAAENYALFTRQGVLSDFKPTRRVGPGVFAALPQMQEDAEYTYGTVGDRGELIALATYGRILKISRQAIINDDLSLFGDMPRRLGRAAKRTVGNLVYAILTGNPTMSDTLALFVAGHGNLQASGAGSALQVSSVGTAITAMKVQSDNGSALNIGPKYLIVPAALEITARQLINSTVDPGASRGHAVNPVANFAELIVDARLDANSTTAWYLVADPNAYDTIEVAYLDGNDAPYLEQMTAWSSDGVEMKVRLDATAAPLDWRTMYRSPGA